MAGVDGQCKDMSASSEQPVVTIIIGSLHIAGVEPSLPWLLPHLEYTARRTEPGGPLGYTELGQQMRCYNIDFRGRPCFPAGLVPRVLGLLRQRGIEPQFEDLRDPGPRLRTDARVLDRCDPSRRRLLEAVAREHLGRIETRGPADTLETCLLLPRLWPEARFLVAQPTREAAVGCWEDLEIRTGERVGLSMSGVRREGKRWHVATYASVSARDAGEWDVLLLPSGEQACGNRAVDVWVWLQFRRVYAFVRPDPFPDPLIDFRLEQMAGPILHRVRRERVPVRVALLPAPACAVTAGGTPLERKRKLYWHNPTRNEHIAALAEAVRWRRRQALEEYGLSARDVRQIADGWSAGVVVLVESPEHARQLRSLLPDWRVWDLVPSAAAPVCWQRGVCGPSIMTSAYAARCGVRTDVLIRATGTRWPLHVKGFPRRIEEGLCSGALLIDLDDSYHPLAQADTRHRLQEYERLGMAVAPGAGH
jgi:hypothetical protein